MHDPMCVAHEIYLGRKQKKNGRYRTAFITIWHVDPEKDGTDDSCGWFMRDRHIPKKMIDDVAKEFESEWDNIFTGENGYNYYCGWFNPSGENIMSVRGIVLNMFIYTAKIVLNPTGQTSPSKMWRKAWKFVNKNYAQIMYFAENNRDSMRDTLVRKFQIGCKVEYTQKERLEMIRECASMVACYVSRTDRSWYKHPRWHIHHWKITFPIFRDFYRKYFQKCSRCGKMGFGNSAAYGSWSGKEVWCEKCEGLSVKSTPTPEC